MGVLLETFVPQARISANMFCLLAGLFFFFCNASKKDLVFQVLWPVRKAEICILACPGFMHPEPETAVTPHPSSVYPAAQLVCIKSTESPPTQGTENTVTLTV